MNCLLLGDGGKILARISTNSLEDSYKGAMYTIQRMKPGVNAADLTYVVEGFDKKTGNKIPFTKYNYEEFKKLTSQ